MSEGVAGLAAYGKSLVEQQLFIDAESGVLLSVDDLQPVLAQLLTSEDESYAVGFLAVVPLFVSDNWSGMKASHIAALKSDIIRCCNRSYSVAVAHQFTSFAADVMRRCDGAWPEMYSFVLNESKTGDIVAFLLAKIVRATEPSVLVQNRFKILEKIMAIFPKVCRDAQLYLLRGVVDLKSTHIHDDVVVSLWRMGLSVSDKWEDAIIVRGIFNDLIAGFDPKISPLPKFEKNEEFMAFIPMITLFSGEMFDTIIAKVINVTTQKIQEQTLPMDISDKIERAIEYGLTPEQTQQAVSFLKKPNSGKEGRSATIFVVLPFLRKMIDENTDIDELGVNWFHDLAIGGGYEHRVWLHSIRMLCKELNAIGKAPDNMRMTIMSLMQSSNESTQDMAFAALVALFQNFIVNDREHIKSLLNVYNNLNAQQRYKFVLSLRVLIECGGFDIEMVQPIIDLAKQNLRSSEDMLLKSAFMALVSSMSSITTQIIMGFVKGVLPVINSVVSAGIPAAVPDAVSLLIKFVGLQPAISRRTLSNVYPKLLAFLKNADNSDALRGKVGVLVAELVEAHYKKKESGNLVDIVTRFVTKSSDKLVRTGAKMVLVAFRSIETGSIPRVYANLARAAGITCDVKTMNVTIEAMRKLLKRKSMNPFVNVRFTYWLLSGSHPVFQKEPIWNWICPKTSVFPFVTDSIEKFPEEIACIIPYLVYICNNSVDEMFTGIFDSFAAAYGIGLVKTLPSERLYEVCYKEVFTQHSTVSLGYVLEKVTDHIVEFTARLCEEWQDMKRTSGVWRCAVADGLFKLAVKRQKVDLSILQLILEEFPYKAEYGYGESMTRGILDAFRENPDLEVIELTLIKKFSDFFLLEQSDFLAFRIDYDTQMEMKDLMRMIFMKDRAYEREIQRYYDGDRVKLAVETTIEHQ